MGKLRELVGTLLGVKKKHLSAIILAGGVSSRFSGSETKQLTPVCGVPLIVHTLRAFELCADVAEIVIVCREGESGSYAELAEKHGITKFRRAVTGGDTRQSSAIRGFAAVSEKTDFVAFHDAARCLVTPEIISSVFREAELCGSAAIAGTAVSDTIKETDSLGAVVKTLDRERLFAAQTPQIFKENVYRAAAYTAQKDGVCGTDDASLAEHFGFPVRRVECGRENIKITFREDIIYAEAVLRYRKERGESEAAGTAAGKKG